MAFGLPELPSIPDPLSALSGAALTALLQRTYFIQNQTSTGIPKLLLVIDTVNDEDPEYSAEVTQHPVEKGSEVSDHIQLHNPTLTIKGKISSTPLDLSVSIGNTLAAGVSAITSSQARSNLLNTGLQQASAIGGAALMGKSAALAKQGAAGLAGGIDAIARTVLLSAYDNKTPFDVVTKRQKYPNMVIESLKFPRNNGTGFALEFEVRMIALRIVSPLQVQLTQLDEKVISTATPSTNLGSQTTQQTNDQTTSAVNGSWLRSIVKGIGG